MSSKGYNLDCNLGYDSFEDCVYYDVLSATSRIRGCAARTCRNYRRHCSNQMRVITLDSGSGDLIVPICLCN